MQISLQANEQEANMFRKIQKYHDIYQNAAMVRILIRGEYKRVTNQETRHQVIKELREYAEEQFGKSDDKLNQIIELLEGNQ